MDFAGGLIIGFFVGFFFVLGIAMVSNTYEEVRVSNALCESIGEDWESTISRNEIQCESRLIRIVPKEIVGNEIRIISSETIIGGE